MDNKLENAIEELAGIDPSQIFQKTLEEESGKDDCDIEDLRQAYADRMASKIQELMPQIDIEKLDFDTFFDCATEAMRPVQLKIDDSGVWFASAIDIPQMINRACDSLNHNEKMALCLSCMTTAASNEPFELEDEDSKTYRCESLVQTPNPSSNLDAIKKLFAAAMLATVTFLAPVNSDAKSDILGTVPVAMPQSPVKYHEQLLRGKDDKVFVKNPLIKKKITKFAELKDKPLIERLKTVNSFWNQFAYKSDEKLYGKDDYWATPSEFVNKKGGDCEDYALVKYWTLRKLGIPAKDMIILVGYITDGDKPHAILSVKDEDGKIWLMDNLNKDVVSEDEMYLKFAPRFTVNEIEKRVCIPTQNFLADLGRNPFRQKETAPALALNQ